MVVDPKTKQILGVHILAPNAGDLIAQAALLIKNKNTVDDVLRSMPVFPTLSESLKYAALAFTKDLSKLRDRKSTRLNSSHIPLSRMPSSA